MKNNFVISGLVDAVIALAGLGAWYLYGSKHHTTKIVGSIDLGFVEGEVASSIYIADQLGLFAQNGITVTLHPFVTGLDSYNALKSGQIDISGPTEYVVVGGILKQDSLRAFQYRKG
jgi:ABC-type nitrate/sulfonate/bicarbonate transport system substrate-binding protein